MLHSAIDNYLARELISFHSPVHGGAASARDLSELTGLDDLQYPSECILKTQRFIAKLFGAAHSYMLVNGASVGLQAALVALRMQYGSSKPVLAARNVHKSVIAGLVLSGLDVEWFEPEWITELGCYGRFSFREQHGDRHAACAARDDEDMSLRAQRSDAKHHPERSEGPLGSAPEDINDKYLALIVTNPTYEGFHSSLPQLDIPIIVDEAHGAHYIFSNSLPASALESGADIVVQSWHKCLGTLTQTGVLHISDRIDPEIMAEALRLLQTTSPSYLLMESISNTAATLARDGSKIFTELIKLRSQVDFPVFSNDDPLRINFYIPDYPCAGEYLFNTLEEDGIALEKYSANAVLGLINLSANAADIERLNLAYRELERLTTKHYDSLRGVRLRKQSSKAPQWKAQINKPRDAFFAGAKIHAPCPPGIALEVPGQASVLSKC